jgi:cytochrome c
MSAANPTKSHTIRRRLATASAAALLILSAFTAQGAPADVPTLLKEKRCVGCHDTSAARIGPPFVAVAMRHRANKAVMVEVLAHKIVLGGGGSWGLVPMVPNGHVTPEEARAIAEWIFTLNPPN